MADFYSITLEEMDAFMRSRRFQPVDLTYRNRPVKEWVYQRPLPRSPNHWVRIYTGINRYGRSQNQSRGVGKDAIRVQVIYNDGNVETLVTQPKRVHRVTGWADNLDKRLSEIAQSLPQVAFDRRGEPMTLRRKNGKYFWGSRDYPKYKETKPFRAEEIRCCKECNKTTGLTTIQAGTYCYDCLPINLGAEPFQKFEGEMEEYAPNETDDGFTSMSNLAYITLPDYDESYYWISEDENSRATVAFDPENEVILIPNFEVSLRVRGQNMASEYLGEMIDDLHSDFGYYPVQVSDVDNHAIGFWEKMQSQGLIDGWSKGSFAAEDRLDYRDYLNDLRSYPELKNLSDEQLLARGIDCLASQTANRETFAAEEMFYYHSTDMTNLESILKEGIRPTADTNSIWGEEIIDISPYPYYYGEIDDILPSVFVADSPEEARWWADEAGIDKIVVLKISSQVENLENFHGDGNGYKTSETIPKEYIVDEVFYYSPKNEGVIVDAWTIPGEDYEGQIAVLIDFLETPKGSKGLGRKEFESIRDWAVNKGAEYIVIESMPETVDFWKWMGFVEADGLVIPKDEFSFRHLRQTIMVYPLYSETYHSEDEIPIIDLNSKKEIEEYGLFRPYEPNPPRKEELLRESLTDAPENNNLFRITCDGVYAVRTIYGPSKIIFGRNMLASNKMYFNRSAQRHLSGVWGLMGLPRNNSGVVSAFGPLENIEKMPQFSEKPVANVVNKQQELTPNKIVINMKGLVFAYDIVNREVEFYGGVPESSIVSQDIPPEVVKPEMAKPGNTLENVRNYQSLLNRINSNNRRVRQGLKGEIDVPDEEYIDYWNQFAAEDNYDATYGKAQAKIRRRLKNKIKKQAIMGTKAGQWSARKSQELKRQYEAACDKKGLNPYKGKKTKSQDNLSKWSQQKWKTASGKKSSTTGEPYFPAKAVAALKKKNLYAKAKRQKAKATKAGKQNARYSDDIRAVVKKYRTEWEDIEWDNPAPSETPQDWGDDVTWQDDWGSLRPENRPEFPTLDARIAAMLRNHSKVNVNGEQGCPVCGTEDLFYRESTGTGTKWYCYGCFYTEKTESQKSQKIETLEKYGLQVKCPDCEKMISAYNQASINSHRKKCGVLK